MSFGSAAESGENALFCLGVEARGDFVQQKDGGVSCYGAGDGEELPLALREEVVFGKCVPSLQEGVDGFGEAGEVYGVLGHVFGDGGGIQCDLRKDAAGDLVEVLEDAADLAAALGIRHEGDVLSADGDCAFFRLVKAQKQLEEGAFADAGAADEGDFLPFFDREGEILKYSRLVFGIAEGDMREEDAAVGATVLGGPDYVLPWRGRHRCV